MPTWRLENTRDILSTGSDGGLYIFMSTDTNDNEELGFGIVEMAHLFVGLLDSYTSVGSFYEDAYGSGGHTMSVRDFKTAIQFFSDVFKNGKDDGTKVSADVTTYGVRTADACPTYLLISEVTVIQQSDTARLNYMANGYTKLDKSTHVNTCTSDRAIFEWGDWDCGGCGTHGPKKLSYGDNPVDVEKFKGKQTNEPEACYERKKPAFPTS